MPTWINCSLLSGDQRAQIKLLKEGQPVTGLFARWPSYLALAWKDRREKVGTKEHQRICQDCHDRVAEMVAYQLLNPVGLSSHALRRAAENDASLNEVVRMCRLFQWLLPGLITNVAYFRHQLEAV